MKAMFWTGAALALGLGLAALAQERSGSAAQKEPRIDIKPDTGEVLSSSEPALMLLTVGIDATGVFSKRP